MNLPDRKDRLAAARKALSAWARTPAGREFMVELNRVTGIPLSRMPERMRLARDRLRARQAEQAQEEAQRAAEEAATLAHIDYHADRTRRIWAGKQVWKAWRENTAHPLARELPVMLTDQPHAVRRIRDRLYHTGFEGKRWTERVREADRKARIDAAHDHLAQWSHTAPPAVREAVIQKLFARRMYALAYAFFPVEAHRIAVHT